MLATASAETPAERHRRVAGRAPGLDGVRALAVLAVITFHQDIGIAPGGFLGVDIFFVLSGYLITDLLVAQWDRDGRLDLGGFWIRRARRLFPALAVMLLAVTAAVAVLAVGQVSALRPALLGAISYTSNWWQAMHHQSYFAQFGPLPPLQHLWSLAVEEQFYLLWPLVLTVIVARLPNKGMRAALAWLAAAASVVSMAVLYVPGSDPSRVYYGTDTHSGPLLVGAALALTWPLSRLASASGAIGRRLDAAGMTGLAVLAWAMGHFTGADAALYPGGLILAALAAGCVVMAAASTGTIAAMLSCRPLRWLGIRSYGIYLWHWPVIALGAAITGPRTAGIQAHLLETVLPIALAALSWRWVEAPVIRDGACAALRGCREYLADSRAAARCWPMRALAVTIPVVTLTVTVTAGYGVLRTPHGMTLRQQIAAGARISAASQAAPRAAAQELPAGASRWRSQPRALQPSGIQPGPGRAQAPSASMPPVLASGAAAGTGRGAPPAADVRHRHVRGTSVTAVGDSVMLASAPELHAALPGIYIDALVSRQMSAGLQAVRDLAASGRLRRIVVVGLGTNGTVTSAQISQLLAAIGRHRWLVLVNTFVPRPWQDEVNGTLDAAARHHPNVVMANWLTAIEHHTSLLWDDGVHPRPPGGRLYARVVQAAIRVLARQPGGSVTTPAARARLSWAGKPAADGTAARRHD